MGFMTLITIFLPIGMNKHQCITSNMLLIVTFTLHKFTLNLYSACSQRFTGARPSLLYPAGVWWKPLCTNVFPSLS